MERVSIRPTLDVNGIWGGYIGEGAKPVLPSVAQAKISMRLVPDQDPKEITELFTKHFLNIAPKSVKVKVTPHHGGQPYVSPTDSVAYNAASKAMEMAFGKKPIPVRSGGSIPIVVEFANRLKASPVLMGLGLNTENLHSPNEHFNLNHFQLGIKSSAYFIDEFAK